jgi:Ser/Thr protein kinase RdoA (MazF antagonist)
MDAARAGDILAREWGIDGDLRPLPSERDRNLAVVVAGVERFVLKVSNANEDPAFLEMQHRMMERLAAAGVPCQLPVPSRAGGDVVDVGAPTAPCLVRVLTWLPGRPLGTIPAAQRPAALLRDLGRMMGRTATALDGFDHPAAHRDFQWSAEQDLDVVAAHAAAVTDPRRAALLDDWQRRLTPLRDRFAGLPHGVIHNDANDHNVLVADDGQSISGLLDLGDAVWSVVVNELAVAAAYAALGSHDPLAVIAEVRAGFEEALPLTDEETHVLLDLVALRLATSVALSAHQSRLAPDDPYLTVSEAPAWALLEKLVTEVPR